ncbi:hypothetical protein WG66_008799 [Moniliophthora roreri]|nr:hypothetical protein WG66_008799 [Moniliophthora roreri]
MAFFAHASGVNISGGSFNNVQRDQHNTYHNTTNTYQDSNNVHDTTNYNSFNRINVNPQAQRNPSQSGSNEYQYHQQHLARATGRFSPWVDQEDNEDYPYPHPPASAPPLMIEENPRTYPYPDLVNDILAGQRKKKPGYTPAHSRHGYQYRQQQQQQYYEEDPEAHENSWQANAARYRQQPAQLNVHDPQPQPKPQYRSTNPFNPFVNRSQDSASAPPIIERDEDGMEGIEEERDEEVVWDPRKPERR